MPIKHIKFKDKIKALNGYVTDVTDEIKENYWNFLNV